MVIITAHNVIDMDALASMIAAQKLYPGSIIGFSGLYSKNVQKFLSLHKDYLSIEKIENIDIELIKRLIVVDTANPKRLPGFETLLAKPDLDIIVYDHHPSMPGDFSGPKCYVEMVGACTTMLVERIRQAKLDINSFEASILALGIYDDTGSLVYSSTTYQDVEAVAYLLKQGASLEVVRDFLVRSLSQEQFAVFQEYLDSIEHLNISNVKVLLCQAQPQDVVAGLDLVTHRVFELEEDEVILSLTQMRKKIEIIGRSRTDNADINKILQPLGGRGHRRAASAMIRDKSIDECRQQVIKLLEEHVEVSKLARDVMSTPVKTLGADISLEEAGKIMLRYGHTGMPIVNGDQVVGIISRRDVDKARQHNLLHAPVKGFMNPQVVMVEADTSLKTIQQIMVKHDIGRVPILIEGRLGGIISRSDILRSLHGEEYSEKHEIMYYHPSADEDNYRMMLEEKLPPKIFKVLQTAGEIAQDIECKIYVVGGFVRDLLLGEINYDIDLVVEGDGEELAPRLAAALGGTVKINHRFRTAVVVLPYIKIDVATARAEYYEFPAALPWVERSSIRQDMYRRDFTINTMAFCLNPDFFGDLIDYFGGREDLSYKAIRVLYNFSFVEDPTRIIRAIRFSQRYGFKMEDNTARLALEAISRNMLGQLSSSRILHELIMILKERDPVPALRQLSALEIWDLITPEINANLINYQAFERFLDVEAWWKENQIEAERYSRWLIYFLILVYSLTQETIDKLLGKYDFTRYAQQCIISSRETIPFFNAMQVLPQRKLSDIHYVMKHWHPECSMLTLTMCEDINLRHDIQTYLNRVHQVKVEIKGEDLIALGLPPGPFYSKVLEHLFNARLNEEVENYADEKALVQRLWEEGEI